MSTLTDGFEAQAKSLREFGYSDVTAEMVKAAHDKWNVGEGASNIIEMMCEGAFNDYPKIFGAPAIRSGT